jgi:hypothetical protein
MNALKIVGSRRPASTPEACYLRGAQLQRQADLMCPMPRPRGFVFKAKTWDEWRKWRAAQKNPRLW